ncbi:hypothetical protein ACVWWG_003802 [Bradyrhizobium sp. LB7.2]
MTSDASDYLVINDSLTAAGRIALPSLDAMTERHHIELPLVDFKPSFSIGAEALRRDSAGVVLILNHGLPNRAQMQLASRCVRAGRKTLFYWRDEKAVEAMDAERLSSFRRHRLSMVVAYRLKGWLDRRQQRRADQMPTPLLAAVGNANAGVLAETAAHIGREAESLETHLKGGITELRRAALVHAEQIENQLAAATGQLQALEHSFLASDGATALAQPVTSVIHMIEAATAGSQGVRAFGESLAGYFEGGLPALERVKQQSSSVRDDIERLGAPAIVAIGPSASGSYGEDEMPVASAFLRSITENPRPVPFTLDTPPTQAARLPGAGVYLRLDFWAPLTSGGSYGHTCYQAKALADTTQDFVAVMANHFQLLDDLGVRQVTVPALDMTGVETNILGMNRHYADRLGVLFEAMRPAYIFERIVLGNAVGAWASRRFNIPYIVEYNGSEISMKRSFAGSGYEHEDLLLLAEDAAFRQASLISVVSDHVAADVARRGIPESRILVNPNAVDLAAYSPATPDERQQLRKTLGFTAEHCVVGFIGTFGGWHGIDVLAASLQPILAGDPSIRFLPDRRRQPEGRGERGDCPARPLRQDCGCRARAPIAWCRASEGLRHPRIAAFQQHDRQSLLRLADEAIRIYGHGRRNRGERSGADRPCTLAGSPPLRSCCRRLPSHGSAGGAVQTGRRGRLRPRRSRHRSRPRHCGSPRPQCQARRRTALHLEPARPQSVE